MELETTRARLAYITVIALVAAGGLAFFVGDRLNGTQISLLTMLITQIANKASAAFGFFFDGTADKRPADAVPQTKE